MVARKRKSVGTYTLLSERVWAEAQRTKQETANNKAAFIFYSNINQKNECEVKKKEIKHNNSVLCEPRSEKILCRKQKRHHHIIPCLQQHRKTNNKKDNPNKYPRQNKYQNLIMIKFVSAASTFQTRINSNERRFKSDFTGLIRNISTGGASGWGINFTI